MLITLSIPSTKPAARTPSMIEPSAINQRYEVICAALCLEPSHRANRFVDFLVHLRQRPVAPEQIVFLLYQLFLARIPSEAEIVGSVHFVMTDPAERVCKHFLESEEFKTSAQSRMHFVTLAESTLAVDVSHTRTYPHNTGIQRVVRSIAKHLRDDSLPHAVVYFDLQLNAYRVLPDSAENRLYDWEQGEDVRGPAPATVPPARKGRGMIKRGLKFVAGKHLSQVVRSYLKARKEKRRALRAAAIAATDKQSAPAIEHVLFLWNNRMLFPEVMLEPTRINAVRAMLSHTPVVATIVLHDLIPLHHPEYFSGNVDGFARYATITRLVDRIACTTDAVATDLGHLLKLARHEKPASVQTHRLGCDFDFGRGHKADEAHHGLPVVVSIGTFEIRKNHLRMLRAMVQAQRAGSKFVGVFVGNPGWLSENFSHELARYQALGHRVEIRQSVSETELAELYDQATFTMFCSLAEGFGLPIVESVSKGVPCIVSNRGCMKELAELLGGCVLVDPESEQKMADAIAALLRDKGRYQKLRAEAERAQWPTWREYTIGLHAFAMEKNSSQNRPVRQQVAA
jgi:glycosyltransferase involved in cell wall biosynthesis